MTDPAARAAAWLGHVYGGLVTLADPRPFAEGERNWLFACRWADHVRRPTVPMLSSTIAVPKPGLGPFPVGNADPLDEDVETEGWGWRVNARNCVVATDATGAEVSVCVNWDQVCAAIVAGGPGTRGVVRLQRQFHGVELTGHLLYAQYRDGAAVILGGQRGTPAVLDDDLPIPPEHVLKSFLTALGIQEQALPNDTNERSALLRSTLAGRKVLLVLDNAHNAAQVIPLLPGTKPSTTFAAKS
ncbi:MAG TPA: toxin glutamine deamidase domain-containing protein [Pseudonocardiaceae bacterium]|nr:toxin glutamine deamidase domain-containing protein [Pseudonocardiaceae bacterium]